MTRHTNLERRLAAAPLTRWLALAVLLVTAACTVPVAAGLEESDATAAVVALEKNGVPSEKERDPEKEGAYRVVVTRDDSAAALRVLSDEGLPPPASPGVLDALGKGSMVPSRLSEQAKLVSGTSGELERSLRALDGVVSARVHLAVAPRDPLAYGETLPTVTASVLIRHHGATPPLAPSEIQRLVAGAVAGLSPEHVSVVLSPAPKPAQAAARELARFGPLTVTRASMPALRGMVAAAVLTNVVLIGCLLLLWARIRRTETAVTAAREEPAVPRQKRSA